jgi:uncharacterized membrane protein YeaQ/YmgE (transglycosylase-associated protein family)
MVLFLLVLIAAIVVLVVIGTAVFGLALKLLWWALIGLFLGALARLVVPGRQPIGLAATSVSGIAGALLGGVVSRAAHLGGVLQFIIAIAAAVVLVLLFSRGRASSQA